MNNRGNTFGMMPVDPVRRELSKPCEIGFGGDTPIEDPHAPGFDVLGFPCWLNA